MLNHFGIRSILNAKRRSPVTRARINRRLANVRNEKGERVGLGRNFFRTERFNLIR